jgi:hypothetical protein
MSNTIGYTADDGIKYAMDNYQYCKKQLKEVAMKNDDVPASRKWTLDMGYWNMRLIAAGALSLEMAAPPPAPGWYMSEDTYEERKARSQLYCFTAEEFSGYPLNGTLNDK